MDNENKMSIVKRYMDYSKGDTEGIRKDNVNTFEGENI